MQDKISKIIFTESGPGNPLMVNFQPSWVEIEKLQEFTKDLPHPKLQVLTPSGLKQIHEITKEDILIRDLRGILTQIGEEEVTFVMGTFRLYSDLYYYAKELEHSETK